MDQKPANRAAALLAATAVCLSIVVVLELAFRKSELGRALPLESAYTSKAIELSDPARKSDVVVLGDSRILHGVDPREVELSIAAERAEQLSVYNGGLPGAPPMGQLALVRRLLTHAHRPRLIVLSISPYMFSSRIVAAMARESLPAIWRLRDLPSALRAGASAEDLALIATCDALSLYRYRPRILDALLRDLPAGPPANTGVQGFLMNGETDPASQDMRARARAHGYRNEMWKPDATFGNEHMGYFVEALRSLKAAGVDTIVLNSPSASQMELAYGPTSIYDEHIAWVRARVAEYGALWADVRSSPAIADEDYVDGDHLGGNGARRFSAWLAHTVIVPALGGPRSERPADCKPLFDFDAHGLAGFTLEGSAFVDPMRVQARRGQQPVHGYTGERFVSSYGASADADQGEALSPAFTLQGSSVRVRVAGGASPSQGVTLLVDGQELGTLRGQNDEVLRDGVFDTRTHVGKAAQLRLSDRGQAGWEHLEIDDVVSCP